MTSANERPADHSVREAIIRDLYALVAFYVANPGHPLPTSVQVFHYLPDAAGVAAIAETYQAPRGVYGDRPQTDHDVTGTSIPISLIVSVPAGKGIDQ